MSVLQKTQAGADPATVEEPVPPTEEACPAVNEDCKKAVADVERKVTVMCLFLRRRADADAARIRRAQGWKNRIAWMHLQFRMEHALLLRSPCI